MQNVPKNPYLALVLMYKKMSTSFVKQQIRGWYQEYLTNRRANNLEHNLPNKAIPCIKTRHYKETSINNQLHYDKIPN